MAARKKTNTRTKKTIRKHPVEQLEERLPATLREYSRRVRKELSRIERDVERATAAARRQGIKLLRLASHELGRLEERGEKEWLRISTPYRRRAAGLLSQLQRAVAPPADVRRQPTRKSAARTSTARKKTAKKKTSKAKATKATRKKTAKRKTATRKITKRKTTKRTAPRRNAARR